ncbi:hypothetical protein C8039_19370 [Halogeometricum sp. wsp3]|nr:hypothetical protein C8039_19370 [Halogeometricum sp. wsp3]
MTSLRTTATTYSRTRAIATYKLPEIRGSSPVTKTATGFETMSRDTPKHGEKQHDGRTVRRRGNRRISVAGVS